MQATAFGVVTFVETKIVQPTGVAFGQSVLVREGPLASFPGVIGAILANDRVEVGASLFGRMSAIVRDLAHRSFTSNVADYFGRTTKAGIRAAVLEAMDAAAVQLIDHLVRKANMAAEAERLVAGTGWLPQPLRPPDEEAEVPSPAPDGVEHGAAAETGNALPAFLTDPDASATLEAEAWLQASE